MKGTRRSFIKGSAGIGIGLVTQRMMPESMSISEKMEEAAETMSESNPTKVGLAEIDVSPEIGMERPGNYYKAYNKSFHDPCKVRVAVIDDGSKATALVSVDALMIPRSLVLSARKRISRQCGIPSEAILIAATHSHTSGPTGMVQPGEYDHGSSLVKELAYELSSGADPSYLKFLEDSIVNAVCEAKNSREVSSLGVGIGMEDKAGANRRYYMKNGLTYTYAFRGNPDIIKPAGPIDPEVGVIGIWDEKGECKGCIVNFARHANCPMEGISANWIYFMEQTIRGAMGADCIVVYLPGANGDISHDFQHDPYASLSSLDKTRYVGSRVGAEAVKVLLSIPRGNFTPVNYHTKVWDIKRRKPNPKRVKECIEFVKQSTDKDDTKWTFAKEIVMLDTLIKKHPAVEVEVQAIQVGPVVFVSNPAEYFCQYGLDIKKQSNFKYTFPVELANGGVGYVPTKEAFGAFGGGYETRLTSYSNLEITAGNQMADTGVELIRKMEPGIEPDFPAPAKFKAAWRYGNVPPELE